MTFTQLAELPWSLCLLVLCSSLSGCLPLSVYTTTITLTQEREREREEEKADTYQINGGNVMSPLMCIVIYYLRCPSASRRQSTGATAHDPNTYSLLLYVFAKGKKLRKECG